MPELDFLFIDGNHDIVTTQWYTDNLFPKLKKGALVAIHDWAVEEVNGEWRGKGDGGVGGLEETQYLMNLKKEGKLPLERLFWNYKNPLTIHKEPNPFWEASFWLKR